MEKFMCFLFICFTYKAKALCWALKDPNWTLTMQGELNHFERSQVWSLTPRPKDHPAIGTKCVFSNKLDEPGVVVRNKARLVKGYNQGEGVDFEEIFAPMARLEDIRILIAFASRMGIKSFHMEVKCAFLSDFLSEKVYGKQPPGYEITNFANMFLSFIKVFMA